MITKSKSSKPWSEVGSKRQMPMKKEKNWGIFQNIENLIIYWLKMTKWRLLYSAKLYRCILQYMQISYSWISKHWFQKNQHHVGCHRSFKRANCNNWNWNDGNWNINPVFTVWTKCSHWIIYLISYFCLLPTLVI